MAYSTRFYFRFDTDAGREMRINIKQDGFSGTSVQRPLGGSPILKRDSGENGIFGTSLEILAECNTDGEFSVLYTSNPREFFVELLDVTNSTTLWTGFVSPELYSEPEVAPPYDVKIIAVDGLGELKLDPFVAAGRQTLYSHLSTILAHSGLPVTLSSIIVVDSLACTTPVAVASNLLTTITVDLDHLADQDVTCYDALEAILRTLNLTITRYGNQWLIVRESDVEVDNNAIAGHTAGGTSVSLAVVQYGSMGSFGWWPVGRMEREVVPAKNRVVVSLPFHLRESMLTNPDLPDGTGWTYPSRSSNANNYVSWVTLNGTRRPGLTASLLSSVSIYQDLTVGKFSGPLTLRLLTLDFLAESMTFGAKYRVHYRLKLTGTSQTYWFDANDASWKTSNKENSFDATKLIGVSTSTEISIGQFNEYKIEIPGLPVAGTLRVEVIAKNSISVSTSSYFILGGVFLTQNTIPGYRDNIVIDNGARGELSEVVAEFGDAPYAPNAGKSLRNILASSGGVLTSAWRTANFTGELLSVIAMDYALGVALPRLRARGMLNVPSTGGVPACIVNPDGIPMLIQTMSWSLVDDEMQVELLSVPSAEMEITSETIQELTEEQAQSLSGSGGSATSGGGGGGNNGAYPQDQFFTAIADANTGDTTGIKALYDLHIIQTPANAAQNQPEVIKDIAQLLRHLSLQVINAGTANEALLVVSDIALAQQVDDGETVTILPYLTTHQAVTLEGGTNNGTLKLTTAAGTTDNIAVTGLGDLAYLSSLAWNAVTDKPTTLSGYGITDANISNGVITLGSNTITPLTSFSGLSASDITTALGNTAVARATGDGAGNNIKSTYAVGLIVHEKHLYLQSKGGGLLNAFADASDLVTVIDTTPVDRAKKDGNGYVIATSYVRNDIDGTIEGTLTIGSTSQNKWLTICGSTSAALIIKAGGSYTTNIYRDSTALQISSSILVTGNIKATGTIEPQSPSDRRLKDNIKTINIGLAADIISRLRPVEYDWNDKAASLGQLSGHSSGFLADEYLTLIPGAGRKIWGDYDAIDYDRVIPYLVAAWQEQNLKIRILSSTLDNLKDDNEFLRRQLRYSKQ